MAQIEEIGMWNGLRLKNKIKEIKETH